MQNFDPLWSSALTVFVVCIIVFFLRKIPNKTSIMFLGPYIGIGFIFYHLFYTYLIISLMGLDLKKILPLHMCDLSFFLVAFNFLKPKQFLFEFGYFWGVFGALCSFLVPTINFTELYLHYFIFHGLLVFGILWHIFISCQKPRKFAFVKILLYSCVVLPTIGPFNYIMSSNYMYLNTPPDFSFIASSPFHIVNYFFLALTLFFLLTLPFYRFFKLQKK